MEYNPYQTPAANLQGTESFGSGSDTSKAVLAVLLASRSWVRVNAVIFMIFCIGTLAMLALGQNGNASNTASRFRGAEIIVMVILAAVNGLLCWKLFAYANGITKLSLSGKVQDLDDALDHHRGFWLTIGILVLIYVGFIVLGLILMFAARGF